MRENRIHKKKVFKLKKNVSLLVLAVACFIGTFVFAFAATEATYTATVDKSEVKRGDILTITVTSSNMTEDARALASQINFDSNAFEYYDGSIEKTNIPNRNITSNLTYEEEKNPSAVFYTYGLTNTDNPKDFINYNGVLYTLTFNVKPNAKGGEYKFVLSNGKYDDKNKNAHEVKTNTLSVKVNVPVNLDSVKLKQTDYSINVGDTGKIDVLYDDTTDSANISYESQNKNVVTVDNNGNITPVKAGSTSIIVTAFGKKLTANVTVTNHAKSIKLSDSKVTLKKGDKLDLSTTVDPEDADDGSVTWTTSNNKVATVVDGKVTAVGGGNAIITATTKGGLNATCSVNVGVPITGINITPSDDFTLTKGDVESKDLSAVITPSDATGDKTITWSSSKESVAKVDNNGVVTLVGKGDAVITASVGNGSSKKEASVKVSVLVPITSFTSDKKSISLYPGESSTINTTIVPDEKTTSDDTNITWATSDDKVATVVNGKVNAISPGSATITANLKNGKKISISVKVLKAISGITLSESDDLKLNRGSSKKLTVTYNPSDADQSKDVNYSSSDGSIVSVSEDGTLHAKAIGSATITASLKANSDIIATRKVTVVANLENIEITNLDKNNNVDLKKGDSFTPNVKYTPNDTTDSKDIKWFSNNTDVATVDANGKVIAKAGGNATITGTNAKKTIKYTVSVIVPIDKVTIDSSDLKDLHKGDTYKIKAVVGPDDNTEDDKTVKYESSNSSVVTVNKDGVVTAKAGGTAVITAKAGKNEVEASVTINVVVPITNFSLNKSKTEINRKSSETLNAIINPDDTTEDKSVSWTSSNPDVATVDANGKVTAKAEGIATITAKLNNGMTASCEVTVKLVYIDNISASNFIITIGDSRSISDLITISPSNATEVQGMTYKSSNDSIATVDANGNVKGISEGKAKIIITTLNGKTAISEVTVKNALNAKLATSQDKILEYISKGNNSFEGKVNVKDVKYVDLSVAFNNDITSSDKNLIEAKAGSKNIIAKYLNIELLLKDKNNDILGNVTELSNRISITVDVPEDVKKAGRKFSIIRIHDGVADVLTDTDDSDDTITFETDKFSTYAIAYENDEVNSNSGISSLNNSVSNPNTSNNVFQYIIMLLASLGVVTGGIYALKKAK